MNKPSGLATKLRALLKAKQTPMWAVIIVLVTVIIMQQIQIAELQWRVDEDHDAPRLKAWLDAYIFWKEWRTSTAIRLMTSRKIYGTCKMKVPDTTGN